MEIPKRFGLFFIILLLPVLAVFGLYIMNRFAPKPERDFVVVYDPDYNIGLLGLENLHPFDSQKYGHVFERLEDSGLLKSDGRVIQPEEVSPQLLLKVHPQSYLDTLTRSSVVAEYTELMPLSLMPARLLDEKVLRPMRLATGGTILAARLALERGLAINLGGGYHHASARKGGGFCIYADISLAIHLLREDGAVNSVMIVDLDAHQGNGPERDFLNDDSVFIFDMYNEQNYPADGEAKPGIDLDLPLEPRTSDGRYLDLLRRNLPQAIDQFQPGLVIYNAGTDVFMDDPLGGLSLSREAIIERDAFVLGEARKRGIPCVMLLSGGYTKQSAGIIADSIINFLANESSDN